jgi:hypothetical protein
MEMEMTHFYKTMQSPVGMLKLVATGSGLAAILWEDDDPKRVPLGDLIERSDQRTPRWQARSALRELPEP